MSNNLSSNQTPPVLLIVFNRPEITKRAVESLRLVKPRRLFIASDGPRKNVPADIAKIQATRNTVKQIDWDCEIKTLFHEENLGCSLGPATAITWFFEHVEEGIILEDDCLPHPTFFRFCQELLERYRHDERIMMISGDDFTKGEANINDSYYFSWYGHAWGWATWRRAWKHFDVTLKLWPQIRDNGWFLSLFPKNEIKYWSTFLNDIYNKKLNTAWDYQWGFNCWTQHGLNILPAKNLVQNIGFDQDATHTLSDRDLYSLPAEPMDFPLRHPDFVMRNLKADRITYRNRYQMPFLKRLKRRLLLEANNLLGKKT